MRLWSLLAAGLFGWIIGAAAVVAPERRLYVAPDGADDNSGLARTNALRTLSRAAALAQPGDEFIVAGGVYEESVFLDRGGMPEHPVVFKAAPGETPVLTMGRRPAAWAREPDTRFVWSAAWTTAPDMVWENLTITRYARASSLSSLDEMPGAFFYDAAAQRLFVTCLLGMAPAAADIVVVNATDDLPPRSHRQPFSAMFSSYARAGFFMNAPHLTLEGFTVCYLPTGFLVYNAGAAIRSNVVYGCVRGITAPRGADTVIAGNRLFRNDCHGINIAGSTHGASLDRMHKNVLICDNDCRENTPNGPFRYLEIGGHAQNIAIYGAPEHVTVERNLAFTRRPEFNWRYKGAYSGRIITRHNVLIGAGGLIGCGKGMEISSNTVISGLLRLYSFPGYVINESNAAPTGAKVEGNLYVVGKVSESDFADPARLDYRLLACSRYLGRGAWPEAAPVRFVAAGGNDAADGATPERAWRSLAHAATVCGPGDTLYVMPGEYCEAVEFQSGVAVKTYGGGRVVWRPGADGLGLQVSGAGEFVLDGLIFAGFSQPAVVLGADVAGRIENCVFDGPGVALALADCAEVCVRSATFIGCRAALSLKDVRGPVVARNCLFKDLAGAPAAVTGRAEIVSEGCVFAGAAAADWQNALRRIAREPHASTLAEVRFVDENYHLPFDCPLVGAGVGHGPVGARGAGGGRPPLVMEDLTVQGVQATQAVLTWTTPGRYPDAVVTWNLPDGRIATNAAPQLPWGGILKNTRRFVRLTGLQAGAPVKVRVTLREPEGARAEAELGFVPADAVRAPGTLYVSVNGSDTNLGVASDAALRTIQAAMLRAVPGDVVLVAPGVYHEQVTVYTGGLSAERPLVLKSAVPGAAMIDCGRLRPGALALNNLEHVVVEGFAIGGLWYTTAFAAVAVSDCRDVTLRHLCFQRADNGVSCRLALLRRTSQALIEDCLFLGGFDNLFMDGCDEVTIAHNTFHWSGVNSITLWGAPDARYRIVSNILVDGVPDYKANPAIWLVPDKLTGLVCDWNLHWRNKSKQMALLGLAPKGGYSKLSVRCDTFAQIQELGYERHGVYADPMFVDLEQGDFRLASGSPAAGLSADGADAGVRFVRYRQADGSKPTSTK